MAQRRVVPLEDLRYGPDAAALIPPPPPPLFTPHTWHLAKLLKHLRPRLVTPPPKKQPRFLTYRLQHQREIALFVRNFVEDLIADVFNDATTPLPEATAFYQNMFQHDVVVGNMKERLRQIIFDFDGHRGNEPATSRDLAEAANMLQEFLDRMRFEKLHAMPSVVYDGEIARLGLQAQQQGWNRQAFEDQLRNVYPYEEFFELTQQQREPNGDRIDWEFDWVQNQLDVRWIANEFMEPMDVTEDDV